MFGCLCYGGLHRICQESRIYPKLPLFALRDIMRIVKLLLLNGNEFDIYELFDHNIAYEIRLQQALENDLLCPFHYFGIRDIAFDADADDLMKRAAQGDFRDQQRRRCAEYLKRLSQMNRSEVQFRDAATDLINYGLSRYSYIYSDADEDNLVLYQKYSRRDVCRILNWEKDDSSTIYGYRIKYGTCPIFVTYEKKADISETTKYEDQYGRLLPIMNFRMRLAYTVRNDIYDYLTK